MTTDIENIELEMTSVFEDAMSNSLVGLVAKGASWDFSCPVVYATYNTLMKAADHMEDDKHKEAWFAFLEEAITEAKLEYLGAFSKPKLVEGAGI